MVGSALGQSRNRTVVAPVLKVLLVQLVLRWCLAPAVRTAPWQLGLLPVMIVRVSVRRDGKATPAPTASRARSNV